MFDVACHIISCIMNCLDTVARRVGSRSNCTLPETFFDTLQYNLRVWSCYNTVVPLFFCNCMPLQYSFAIKTCTFPLKMDHQLLLPYHMIWERFQLCSLKKWAADFPINMMVVSAGNQIHDCIYQKQEGRNQKNP